MANRTRNNAIYLMLSDDEQEVLDRKYKLSGCKSLRQFIMKCIFEKDIFVLDMEVFRDMGASIGRTTGSIHQIAKRVNSTGIIYREDINDLKDLLQKQGREIYALRKKIYSLGNFYSEDTEEI